MAELDEGRLAIAVDRLYEAAMLPEALPEALESLAQAAGGFGSTLVYGKLENDGWYASSESLAEPGLAYASEGWSAINFRVAMYRPEIHAWLKFIPEAALLRLEDLDRQPMQNDFFRHWGMRCFAGFALNGGEILGTIERGQQPFADWELAALRRISPHLDRIGTLAKARGQALAQGVVDGLSLLNRPALLLDRHGGVLSMNQVAEPLFVPLFTIAGGALVPRDIAAQPDFGAMLAAAVAPCLPHGMAPAGPVALRRPGRRPVMAQAVPIAGRAQDLFRAAKAVLTLVDPEENTPPGIARLRSLFQLTEAEAALAGRLAQGQDLDAIALERKVTKETLRTHLGRIFVKTGSRRQSELVMLLNRILLLGLRE